MPNFFIQPSIEETVDVREVVKFSLSIGAILLTPIWGISPRVHRDKKAEEFEDAYPMIWSPFSRDWVPCYNLHATAQHQGSDGAFQQLCQNTTDEISGVDINSSRQSFNCLSCWRARST